LLLASFLHIVIKSSHAFGYLILGDRVKHEEAATLAAGAFDADSSGSDATAE